VPSIGTFNDPASWLAAHAANERRFASAARVRDDLTPTKTVIDDRVVVAFVETAVDRSTPTWCAADRIVDRAQRLAHIGHIRAAEHDPKRDAVRVRDEMAFRAAFGSIRGVSARVVPPLGAFTMTPSSAVQSQSSPTWSS
jgi:hypothetical protein